MWRNTKIWLNATVGAVLLAAMAANTAHADVGEAPACTAPSALSRLDQELARTTKRLTEGKSLRIVALGSSSTAGAGASSPARSYPSRLEAELRERFPDMDIVVLNRGIGGEDAKEEVARLEKSVIAEHPDLVLWQVGTNAIVDEERLSAQAVWLRSGIARLKAAGIDVMLVDPQYVPKVISKPRAPAMVRLMETVARQAHIPVFRRFAIMSDWRVAQRVPFETFTSRDGLHLNDWSYGCIAKLIAGAIVETTNRPIASRTAGLGS
jgi:lysophospholipase L1-like esterase